MGRSGGVGVCGGGGVGWGGVGSGGGGTKNVWRPSLGVVKSAVAGCEIRESRTTVNETMVETIVCWYRGIESFQGFLGGEMDFAQAGSKGSIPRHAARYVRGMLQT